VVGNEYCFYSFYSKGPKRLIEKAAIYTKMQEGLYNLAFGDWNADIQSLDDSVRTNNGDRDKVLATVAFTASSAKMGTFYAGIQL
jgi:hypothetical protein